MLQAIRDNWEKSKAAALIDQAFSRSPLPFLLSEPPAKFANRLVETFWSLNRRALDGSTGPKPSPVAVAAGALAQGVGDYRESELVMGACYGALLNIVEEVQQNRFHYSLNGPDLVLLEAAEAVLQMAALASLEGTAQGEEQGVCDPVQQEQPADRKPFTSSAGPPLDKNLRDRATDIDNRLRALSAQQPPSRT